MAFHPECEIKFIEVDHDDIRRRLKMIGATHVFTENMETVSFRKEGSGYDEIRIRRIGSKLYVTKKMRPGGDTREQREEQYEVTDWDGTIAAFRADGFQVSKSQFKHREHYELAHFSFELETVEGIPPYMEIEAPSIVELEKACVLLGLEYAQGKNATIRKLYPNRPSIWD